MKIYVVNGFPESGKTTFEEYVKESLQNSKYRNKVFLFSTITNVKKIAQQIGWDGKKTPKDREFLSDLKDLLTTYNDYPYKSIKKEIQKIISKTGGKTDGYVFFIDCREPEEIKKIARDLHAQTICVRRPEVETYTQSNHADSEVLKYNYDFYIWNKGTLEEFEKNIDTFIEEELKGA